MSKITQSRTREIVEDFVHEIRTRQKKTEEKKLINFRSERVNQHYRDIMLVPIGLLRFRKDNGRITSDILDYECTHGLLNECDVTGQKIIGQFLKNKAPEKGETLLNNIRHSGQIEPAIITCDGFLVNGNRRKMVMDQLCIAHPHEDRFKYMKVVILPGKQDEGGAPTLLEIEQIESRYQLQSDGKSEYYGFDRALSIRRKIQMGFPLIEQVHDDPQHTGKTEAQIKKEIKNIEKEYLAPLECIDRYLKQFGREQQYNTVSTGTGDREGRWQAFIDYNTIYSKFKSPAYLEESGVEEDEISDLEEAAFNIIRLRDIPGMSKKVHSIMREFHKYCAIKEGKKEILDISKNVEPRLPDNELYKDSDHKIPLPREDIDALWKSKNQQAIIFHLKRASDAYDNQKEKETPIGLLNAALNKLTHKDMDMSSIKITDYGKARDVIGKIKREADNLEKKIYEQDKKFKKLGKKPK